MSDWYEDYLDHIDDDAITEEDERFDWDDGNLRKLEIHGVTAEEAQEALLDPRGLGMAVHKSPDEMRLGAIGATEDGRILAIVFTMRGEKMRVVTVRNATPAERRRYRR